jgi:hypothetical protein
VPYNYGHAQEQHSTPSEVRGPAGVGHLRGGGVGHDGVGVVYGRVGQVLLVSWATRVWAVRKVLAGHTRSSFGRGSYRSVQPVRVAGVAIVYLLRVLLVLEVVAVVEVALLWTLRPRRRK